MNTNNYVPQPIVTDDVKLPPQMEMLAEQLARNVHENWAKTRVMQGWSYGTQRDDAKKLHPCLIPYEDLPEDEKVYDRDTALETLRLITKLGFTITCTK